MKRFLLALLMIAAMCSAMRAFTLPDETLHYVVTYKWGLINKDAGDATLSLRNRGTDYVMTLTARSKPWADKIYRVRDTLTSIVEKDGFRPKRYVKAAHEDGKYMLDVIDYRREGTKTHGAASFLRIRKGKNVKTDRMLAAEGEAFDMLSIFYYIRKLDFSAMKPGQKIRSTVFSGTKSETVTITFHGKEKVKPRRRAEEDAYKITFTFTTDGKKKSSDDMQAWISVDPSHKVLQIIGKLPVGQVRVVLK